MHGCWNVLENKGKTDKETRSTGKGIFSCIIQEAMSPREPANHAEHSTPWKRLQRDLRDSPPNHPTGSSSSSSHPSPALRTEPGRHSCCSPAQ